MAKDIQEVAKILGYRTDDLCPLVRDHMMPYMDKSSSVNQQLVEECRKYFVERKQQILEDFQKRGATARDITTLATKGASFITADSLARFF